MSNVAAGKKFNDSIIESNRTLKVENESLKNRNKASAERNNKLEERVNDLADDKGVLQERLGGKVAESAALDEAGRRMELWVKQLQTEKSSLHEQLGALQDKYEQQARTLSGAQEERAKVELQLAVVTSEKEGEGSLARQAVERLTDEKKRLEDGLASSGERLGETASALDALQRERDALHKQLAAAEADTKRLETVLAKSEEHAKHLQADKDHAMATQAARELQASEASKDLMRQRDVALAEKAAAAETLAVSNAERLRFEERASKAEEQVNGLLAERPTLLARANTAEERQHAEATARNAKADECTRLLETLGQTQGEKRGKEELLLKLEQQLTVLSEENKLLLARCEAAETRAGQQHEKADSAQAERAAAAEQMAQGAAERLRAEREETSRTMESRFADERGPLLARVDFAEARVAQLTALRDEAQAGAAATKELLMTAQEARTQLQEQLAIAQSEKRAADELARLAEARGAETAEARDTALRDRNAAAEGLQAAQATNRTLEAQMSKMEAQLTALQAERAALEAKVAGALDKAEDMLRQRDGLQQGKDAADTALVALREEKAAVQSELLTARAEGSVRAERAERYEQMASRAHDDKMTLISRAEAAEAHGTEMMRQRDVALADGRRASEQLAVMHTSLSKLEERSSRLDEMVTKLTDEKSAMQASHAAAEAALQATVRTAEGAAQARIASSDERHAHACAERDTKADECNRLLEQLAAGAAEKRGKEELLRQLEAQLEQQAVRLGEENKSLAARVQAADERSQRYLQERDAVQAERAAAAEQLAQANSERWRFEEMVRKAEARLSELKGELMSRVDFAEARVAQLTALRDEAQTAATSTKEQLVKAQEARMQLQEQHAVTLAEKRAADEMFRLADTRATERGASCDTALRDRNAAAEGLQAAQATNRTLEAQMSKMEAQLTALQAERAALEAKVAGALDKAEDMLRQRDGLQQGKDAADTALVAIREEKTAMTSQLAEAALRARNVEETTRLTEQQLKHERDSMYEQMVKLQMYVSAVSRPAGIAATSVEGESPSSVHVHGGASSAPGSSNGMRAMQRSPTLPLPEGLLSTPGMMQ